MQNIFNFSDYSTSTFQHARNGLVILMKCDLMAPMSNASQIKEAQQPAEELV